MDKKEIKVMSREDCLIAASGGSMAYGIEGFDKPTAIISISGPDEKIPEILNSFKADKDSLVKDVLFLQFDDIEQVEKHRKLMTLKDAMKISLFVDSLPKESNKLLFIAQLAILLVQQQQMVSYDFIVKHLNLFLRAIIQMSIARRLWICGQIME